MHVAAKKQTLDERWTEYADTHLKGRTIIGCRYLSKKEAEGMGWYRRSVVMVLDDGTLIFSSKDDEGSDAGAMFGNGPNGEELTFPAL